MFLFFLKIFYYKKYYSRIPKCTIVKKFNRDKKDFYYHPYAFLFGRKYTILNRSGDRLQYKKLETCQECIDTYIQYREDMYNKMHNEQNNITVREYVPTHINKDEIILDLQNQVHTLSTSNRT